MNAWLPKLAASLSWQTRLSPHFLLHYHNANPQGEKDNLGDTFAGTLEQIYTQLEQFLQIIPQSKQKIGLTDKIDLGYPTNQNQQNIWFINRPVRFVLSDGYSDYLLYYFDVPSFEG